MSILDILKHLPGKHPQKTHAGGVSAHSNSVGWTLRTKDPFGSKEHIPDESDVELVNKLIKPMKKAVKSIGEPQILLGGVSPQPGHHTKARDGNQVVMLNPKAIREAVDDKSVSDETFKSWYGGAERSYEGLFQHVLAHELGHRYRVMRPDKLAFDKRWAELYQANKASMSGYSTYYNNPIDGFTDSFAQFVTGQDMAPPIEKFFIENVS